jgi:2-polyprenyl-6-methoxyphenol hydroxylase-like FAD-dependent oxidoreductase
VRFGTQFKGYTQAPNRRLDVAFTDQHAEQTNLLIGADGVRSTVRRQRMPKLGLLDTEGRAVFGKTPITPGFFDRVPRELSQGLSLIGESNDSKMKLFCDIMTFDRSRGAQAAQDLGLSLPADYLYWVLVFRRDVVKDHSFGESDYPLIPEHSAERSQQLTAHWHPRIRRVLIEQDPSAASSLTFHAAEPRSLLRAWEEEPIGHRAAVTLLGDAAHPMPPMGGFGANAAFQDAAALCDALCNEGDNTANVRSYEQDMRVRARSVVQRSIEGSGRFFRHAAYREVAVRRELLNSAQISQY